jgi:hypothetical protein
MASLVTLETVKSLTNIGQANISDDGALLGVIEGVEARFQKDVGWDVLTGSYTEYFSGTGSDERTFGFAPVTAVTSLSEVNSFEDDTWTTIATTKYRLRSTRDVQYLKYPNGFSPSQEYRVVFVAGYADTAIPNDIQLLLATWSIIEWLGYERANKGLMPHVLSESTTSPGGVTVSKTFAKPKETWVSMVQKYKRTPYQ